MVIHMQANTQNQTPARKGGFLKTLEVVDEVTRKHWDAAKTDVKNGYEWEVDVILALNELGVNGVFTYTPEFFPTEYRRVLVLNFGGSFIIYDPRTSSLMTISEEEAINAVAVQWGYWRGRFMLGIDEEIHPWGSD